MSRKSILDKIKNNLKEVEIEKIKIEKKEKNKREKSEKKVKKEISKEELERTIIEFELHQIITKIFMEKGLFCEKHPLHVFVPEDSFLMEKSKKEIICANTYTELEIKINNIFEKNKRKSILIYNVDSIKSMNFTKNIYYLWNKGYAGVFEKGQNLEEKYMLIKNEPKKLELFYPYQFIDTLFYKQFFEYDDEDYEMEFDNLFKFQSYQMPNFHLMRIIEIF